MAKTLVYRGGDHVYGRLAHRRLKFVAGLLLISLLEICLSLLLSATTHAAQTIPYMVNFQGRLTDASGNIKPDGQYNIKFRLMSASSGGTNLWEGDRVYGASDNTVTVTNGLFSIRLGDTTKGDPALSPSLFNTATNATIYLEIELPTPATATCATNGCASFTEGAMTPRSLLASAAYAFNADTVDGIDGSSLARVDTTNTFTASNTYNSGTTNTYNGAVVHNSTDTIANNQLLGLNIQGTAGSYTLQNTGTGGYLYNDGTNFRIGMMQSGSAGSSVSPTTSDDTLILSKVSARGPSTAINQGETWGSNLADNPSFEYGCTGWTLSGPATPSCETANPHSGGGNLRVVKASSSNTFSGYQRHMSVQPGEQYYAEVWAKTSAATTGTAGIGVAFYDSTGSYISQNTYSMPNPGTTYTRATVTATAPASASTAIYYIFVNGDGSTGGNWYLDDIYAVRADHPESPVFQNGANSSTAFAVKNAGGTSLFNVDTQNTAVTVGANNAATTSMLVVSQTSTGDTGIQVKNSTNNYFAGIDASDGNKLKFGASGNTTAGVTVNSANYDSGNSNTLIMTLVQAATTGTVSTVHTHVGAISGNIAAAVYADNGSQTGPTGAALATSNSTALGSSNSWQAISLTSTINVTAGSYYWIATNLSSNTTQQDFQSTSDGLVTGAYTLSVTFGTWPSSPSVTPTGSTAWAMNMDIVAGTVTDQFTASAFSLGQNGQATYKNIANSTTAFQIQTSAGTNLLVADTVNQAIKIGGGDVSASDTPTLLVLDWKTGALDPTNGVDGAMYYNDNTLNFRCYRNNAWHSCSDGLVASNTSVPGGNTVASTASETNFASNYSIPANDCQPGRVYKVWARGVYGTTGSPNLTLRVKIGTTNVGVTAAVPPGNSATNQGWSVDFNITCITMSSSGTVEGQGYAVISTGTAAANTDEMQNTAVSSAINFTTAQTLQLSAQWGTSSSSNTITLRQLVVESLGPA
jgi:Carbohydrate binding domain